MNERDSLILYLESRAVDYGGRVNHEHLNVSDLAIIREWVDGGYIEYGRIASEDVSVNGSMWVKLGDRARGVVATKRKEMAERRWETRTYQRTCDE